jgi:hypothetical protein
MEALRSYHICLHNFEVLHTDTGRAYTDTGSSEVLRNNLKFTKAIVEFPLRVCDQ